MVIRVTPSERERSVGALSSETVESAGQCIRMDGVLIIEDIVDAALIEEAKRAFLQKYASCLDRPGSGQVVEVGERRLMITVEFDSVLGRRELFANSWLLPILASVFDDDFVLDAYGVVCSLPGASRQHIHQDGGDIFPQAGLNRLLPTVAVTVAIPLLEMNGVNGTTAVWPGSHRDEARGPIDDVSVRGDEPHVRLGSCMLWDYRLRHGGTPNRSAEPRPLLYMTYCRQWFMDHKNYKKLAQPDGSGRRLHASLQVPRDFLAELSEDLRRLLARAEEC